MESQKKNKALEILVMKFGGTSVGSPETMRTVAEIVGTEKPRWRGVIPIVSALNGVTNLLLDTAHKAAAGDRLIIDESTRELHKRHREMIDTPYYSRDQGCGRLGNQSAYRGIHKPCTGHVCPG